MRFFMLFACLEICASLLPGQVQGQESQTLAQTVEAFLQEADDKVAARKLRSLLASRPAVSDLSAAIQTAPPKIPQQRFKFKVPHRGELLRVEILVPKGHSSKSKPLPVVVNLLLGRIPDTVEVEGCINAWVRRYDPERMSEDGRDGFLKVAHAVAWRANGDLANLWLTGFSWAGHATFDIALHRPDILRGFIAMAGAPRRSSFRLLPNLKGQSVFAFCGSKDDRELIWNLKELNHGRGNSDSNTSLVWTRGWRVASSPLPLSCP